MILLAVSRLYLKLKNLFKNNHLKPSELRILPETCLAWNEVVQTEMYNKFTLVWRKLTADWYNQKDIPPEWITVLQNVCEVVLDGLQMRKSEKVNESLNLALECTKWMKSPHAVIQITSFRMCNR